MMQATRWQILVNLKKVGSLSVDELARVLELTPNCIRQHLTVLERDAFVDSTLDRVPMGRPRQLFTLTSKADDLFPKGYHNLVDWLLEEIKEDGGQEKLNGMLDRLAKKLALEVAEDVKVATFEEKVGAASKLLNSMGAITEWHHQEDEYVLHSYNCSFARVAPKHKEICRLHLGMVSAIIGSPVEKTQSMADGDRRCSYALRHNNSSVRHINKSSLTEEQESPPLS